MPCAVEKFKFLTYKKRKNGQSQKIPIAGNEEMANLLMQRGSHVDLQTVDGLTPLHYAANNGNFAFSEALIKHGATVDALDHNLVTPLQLAVFNGMS